MGRDLTHGVEAGISGRLGAWKVEDSFTTTQAIDRVSGARLLRRASVANTFSLGYGTNSWDAEGLMRYVGRRDDIRPVSYTRQSMPAFFT